AFHVTGVQTCALPIFQLNRTVPEAGAAVGARRWRPVRPHIPPGIRTIFFVAGLNGFLAWAVVGLYLALVPALLERALNSDDPARIGGASCRRRGGGAG